MVKSSPEKLAAALRANLKRRKTGAAASPPPAKPPAPTEPGPQTPNKPPKN